MKRTESLFLHFGLWNSAKQIYFQDLNFKKSPPIRNRYFATRDAGLGGWDGMLSGFSTSQEWSVSFSRVWR